MSHQTRGIIVRGVELLHAAGLIVLPTRLHWSRRSSRVLALAGATLVAAGIVAGPDMDSRAGTIRSVVRSRDILIGLSLVGSQYLLSEETSTVQWIIAGLGGMLMAFGLLSRRLAALPSRSAPSK